MSHSVVGIYTWHGATDRHRHVVTTWGKDRPVYFLVANHTAYPEHDVVVSNYTRNPALPAVSAWWNMMAIDKNMVNGQTTGDYDGYESHVPKHIGGLPLLYEKHPDAEWFLIVGDDNFVSYDRLCEAVAPLDPEVHRTLSEVAAASRVGDTLMPYAIGGGAGIMTSRRTTREASLYIESWWKTHITMNGMGSNDMA